MLYIKVFKQSYFLGHYFLQFFYDILLVMNRLLQTIYSFIRERELIPDNCTLIVGLSGGPDSVFLLCLLAKLQKEKGLTLVAAHLNHEWRIESAQDEELCKQLCNELGIPLISKKLRELNIKIKDNGSQEEVGRKARRHFFESLAKEYQAHAIVLAHHADDQQETFFIRLMRGASLQGLVGMKAQEGLYIRPLLSIKKEDILHYLHENNITYAVDKSNDSPDYLRNRIRHSVIPALRLSDHRFDATFATTHDHLQQAENFLQNLAEQTFKEISTHNAINTQHLLGLHPVLRTRVTILWLCAAQVPFVPSQGLFDEIMRFLEKPGSGEHTFYARWRIIKNNGTAHIPLY